MTTITRRTVLFTPLLLMAQPLAAEEQPWAISLLTGDFDGKAYVGGLKIKMKPGWKTYWRVPGAGGVPPEIMATGNNLAAFRFDCPLPARYRGEDGETIGYKDEVVFPFYAEPRDLSKPLELAVAAFVGVCDRVCIPVSHTDSMRLFPASSPSPHAKELNGWIDRVPKPSSNIITSATTVMQDGNVAVALKFAKSVQDVFVEGSPLHFFNAPTSPAPFHETVLTVNGAKSPDDLRGTQLRATVAPAAAGGGNPMGFEQFVTVL